MDTAESTNVSDTPNVATVGTIKKDITIGEKRVRVSFNPSNNADVDKIKKLSAELIDVVSGLSNKDARLAALAMTKFEEGAMWAVKLATTTVE